VLRVVLDTVVFVRALINPRSRAGRLVTDYADRYELIMSKPVAQELVEVLRRPELTRKYTRLEELDVHRLLDIVGQAEAVEIGIPKQIVRDPDDDIFVATATEGQADYLVTEDKDMLVLESVGNVSIVTIEAFVRVLEERGA